MLECLHKIADNQQLFGLGPAGWLSDSGSMTHHVEPNFLGQQICADVRCMRPVVIRSDAKIVYFGGYISRASSQTLHKRGIDAYYQLIWNHSKQPDLQMGGFALAALWGDFALRANALRTITPRTFHGEKHVYSDRSNAQPGYS